MDFTMQSLSDQLVEVLGVVTETSPYPSLSSRNSRMVSKREEQLDHFNWAVESKNCRRRCRPAKEGIAMKSVTLPTIFVLGLLNLALFGSLETASAQTQTVSIAIINFHDDTGANAQ